MKKLLWTLILVPFLLASCNDDDNKGSGNGTIKLNASVNTNVTEQTKVTNTDYNTYLLTITGTDKNETMSFPSSGEITDVIPGTYSLSLTSHPDRFTTPAFGSPVYQAQTSVTVESGKTAEATLACTQANAGVFFVYDETLVTGGYENVVATVSQGSNSLEYSGTNRESIGYFTAGTATVTLANGGAAVTFDGATSKTLELEANKNWKITLAVTTGGLTVTVEVVVVSDPTDTDTWGYDTSMDNTLIINGMGSKTVTVTSESDESKSVTLTANGYGVVPFTAGTIIKSVTTEGENVFMIGRKSGEGVITLKTDGENVILNEESGIISVNTIEELNLINSNLSGAYQQTADLYLMDIAFTPIGESGEFTGSYSGMNKTVYGLNIEDTTSYTGFFRQVSGSISNLKVHAAVSGKTYIGIICGALLTGGQIDNCETNGTISATDDYIGGITATNAGSITNTINNASLNARGYLGGIAAVNSGTISFCENTGVVSGVTGYVGGISGNHKGISIDNCNNSGAISSNGELGFEVGGVAGISSSLIANCTNSGDVTSEDHQDVGGIVGNSTSGTITDCKSMAVEVSGVTYVGGFIGKSTSTMITRCVSEGTTITATNTYAGGFIGQGSNSPISMCYYNGPKVSATQYVGGFMGGITLTTTGQVTGCYAIVSEITGTSNLGGFIGRLYASNKNCISGSYAVVDTITGTTNLGGFAGYIRGNIDNCYWSGNIKAVYGTLAVVTNITDVYYFNDGTDPGTAATGWPADDAGANWGVYTSLDAAGSGAWWANLGTSGTTDYPAIF